MADTETIERILFARKGCRVTRGVGTTRYTPVLTASRLVLLGEALWRDWLWALCHIVGIIGAGAGFGLLSSVLSPWSPALRLVVQVIVAIPAGYAVGYIGVNLLLRIVFPRVVKFEEQLSHVLKNPNAKWVDRAKEYASETIEYSRLSIRALAVEQHLGAPSLVVEQADRQTSFRAKADQSTALRELVDSFSTEVASVQQGTAGN